MVSLKKRSIMAAIVFILLILLFAMSFIYSGNETVDNNGKPSEWLGYFMEHDFDSCDKLVENSKDWLYSANVMVLINDWSYYDAVYDALIDCIDDISVLENDAESYRFKVSYHKVNPAEYDTSFVDVDDFDVDVAMVELFESACLTRGSETGSNEFVFTVENGYVLGTREFTDTMLDECGIMDNVKDFEENAKDELAKVFSSKIKELRE